MASTKKSAKARQARERLAVERAARARRERRAKILIYGITGLVVVVIVAAAVWAVTARKSAESAVPEPMASIGTGRPPWPVPSDPIAAAKAAGLQVSTMEGTANHFHAHVDVIVDGKPVQVPADIGIDQSTGQMSELHTHDASGIVHVESPAKDKRYILGQMFRAWGVRLDQNDIGGLRLDGDNQLRTYVNGKRVSGNPAAIELKNRQETAVVYGPPDSKVKIPSSYDWPADL